VGSGNVWKRVIAPTDLYHSLACFPEYGVPITGKGAVSKKRYSVSGTLVAMMAILGFVLIILVWWSDARTSAGKRARYTTIRLGDKHLLQRDPYMGRIIRLPGGKYLNRKEFSVILKATKAEAARKNLPVD
jgi:hypothetical protein